MPGGWKGRRNDGLEVLIFREGKQYTAYVRQGTAARLIGDRASLHDAAWFWWKWGREDQWP
jgi:hypothetical protein